MARSVNEKEYAHKRNQILDVTQRLIYTKGYDQMAIQDILGELQISKGAFYHYFESKPDLLEALIERMGQEALDLIRPIVEDPNLPALEKLQRFFNTAVRWKTARKAFLMQILHVWYADHNAIVRQKILAMWSRYTLPLLTTIFQQGIREGVLNIAYPDQVGSILLSIVQGVGDAFAELLLVQEPRGDELQRAERLVAAYNDALERMLGAPSGSLELMDSESLKEWFVAPGDTLAVEASATSAVDGFDTVVSR